MSDHKLLEIKNLTVQYLTVDGCVHAVEGLNLSLNEGETLGLVGETGAGKTTTVKSIMRILPDPPAKIQNGEIYFEGEDLLKKSKKEMQKIRGKQISMIFQDPMTSLNPIITVGDQIMEVICLHDRHMNKLEAYKKACEMLELVGIKGERAKDYPHQFSGGMKQRVIIAMALACNPKLLIADEPTTAIDAITQYEILEEFIRIKKQKNTAMLFITHDLGAISKVADRILVMNSGHVVDSGSFDHILKHADDPYTRMLVEKRSAVMRRYRQILHGKESSNA